MQAARYFGGTAHTCNFCRHRRFHTRNQHAREMAAYVESLRPARRRRSPGAPDFNAQCDMCLRGQSHTDGEHDRQVQDYLDSEYAQAMYDADDFRDQRGL
jgi:hypothetical protein